MVDWFMNQWAVNLVYLIRLYYIAIIHYEPDTYLLTYQYFIGWDRGIFHGSCRKTWERIHFKGKRCRVGGWLGGCVCVWVNVAE